MDKNPAAADRRKERLDRGIKVRTEGIYAVSSWQEVTYLVLPRLILIVGLLLLPLLIPSLYWKRVVSIAGIYALLALGFDFLAHFVGLVSLGGAFFIGVGGYTAAIRLLRLLPRPTAIFIANDLMALGALVAVREFKLTCPEDVSIVSFDGLDITEFSDPALTAVYQPGYQLGQTAARLLLKRINGMTGPARKIVLTTELKFRNSVASVASRNLGRTPAVRTREFTNAKRGTQKKRRTQNA